MDTFKIDVFKLKAYSKHAVLAGLISILASCGGSGSGSKAVDIPDNPDVGDTNTNICRGEIPSSSTSDSGDPVGDILTGHFADSAVAGLTYSTATQSGITDAAGTFMYKPGEAITFSVGGIVLGETVAAKAAMTPYDLVPEATLCTTNRQVEKLLKLSQQEPERKAFNIFTNTLIFLQTLDEDNNPDNGINIPAEINTMFEGVTLNFEQDFRDFSDRDKNAALRKIANLAGNDGLLAYGGIRKPGKALDHFYNAQGIESKFVVATEHNKGSWFNRNAFTYDDNGNLLNTNSLPNPSAIYTYDANGNFANVSAFRSVHTGTNSYEFSYAANGDLISSKTSSDGPAGLFESISIYDADGNVLSITSSYKHDFTSQANYSYSADGKLLELVKMYFDGSTYSEAYTYDSEGKLLEFLETNRDGDVSLETYTYDIEGRILEHIDDNSNGNRISETYTYNDEGKLVSHDKIVSYGHDVFTTYGYSEEGYLQTEITEDEFQNHLVKYTSTYNENGDLLSKVQEITDSGGGVWLGTESYLYDANGKILSSRKESNVSTGNPDIVNLDTYSYHANGELSNHESVTDYDYNLDGSIDKTLTKVDAFDSDGYLLSETTIENNYDGSELNSVKTYNYDADGNLLSISNGSGVIESYTLLSTGWSGFLRQHSSNGLPPYI